MTIDGAMRMLIDQLPRVGSRRVDSWMNVLTGIGSSLVDKVKMTVPAPFYGGLSDQVLNDLFHNDATVRKGVCKLPDDALRHGVRVHMPKEAGGHEAATSLQDAMDDLLFVPVLRETLYWERLFGGAVMFMAIDDGQYGLDSQAQPLREESIRRIHWLRALDRTRVRPSHSPLDLDLDETSKTFGEPLIYDVDLQLNGIVTRVHRSRLIVFEGAVTTEQERRARDGWGISVLDPVFEVLQRNATAWQSSANAVANAQYVIYKLKGLASMFGRPGGEEQAKARARSMEMAKSMINAVLIDADDEYVRENPNFGNLPSMLDQLMLDVCSAFDMPATVLYGRSPAGMNATGESDMLLWEGSVAAYQEHHIRAPAQRFVELVMRQAEGPTGGTVEDGWRVHFPALRQLTDAEKADIRAKISHADEVDIKSGVLLPQEVATSRYRPEGYSLETQVNLEIRERLLKLELEQREKEIEEGRGPGMHPPVPVPPGPGAAGGEGEGKGEGEAPEKEQEAAE